MQYLKHLIILLAIATTTFFVSNVLINGSLNHKLNLGGELKSSADSLYQWKISQEAPFKYRVLHRAVVAGVYQIISGSGGEDDNELFFTAYRIMAFIFHYLAICLFYYFLNQTKLKIYALAGAIIFALLPAMSLAYNVPVHTREDTLAYSLLLLGLVSIFKNKSVWILAFSILGILCRETLLLLPFVNLFFNPQQKIFFRLLIAGLCFATFFGIRMYIGYSPYNHWEGFDWNRTHLIQVIGFAFITFGVFWFPFLLQLKNRSSLSLELSIITRSGLPVFLIVFFTTFIGGIFNEIRIIYLIAPWVISLSLDFYSRQSDEIGKTLRSKNFKIYAITLICITTVASYISLTQYVEVIKRSRYDIPYSTWIFVATIQVFFFALSLPYFRNKFRGLTNQ